MGWCSGTDVFDPVVSAIVQSEASRATKIALIVALIQALENEDWDCQDHSIHWHQDEVIEAFRITDPEMWDTSL